MKAIREYWYFILTGAFLVFAAGVFIVFGEESYIGVHDNLDLFIPQYRMMRAAGVFWPQGAEVPFLGGVSRDLLPSEFSLYTMLYMILPDFAAYVAGYLLKIVIAVGSCYLLVKDWHRGNSPEDFRKYRAIVCLVGLAYGMLNVFPNFGIPFASIPLAVFLIRRIYAAASVKKAGKWYLALFLYPLLSYFSYFGLFLLGYLAVGAIWVSVKDRKVCGKLFLAVAVLAAGYIGCEYRLFGQMFFGGEESIRASFVAGSFSFEEIVREITSVWSRGIFHAESVHTWLILPVCVIYFAVLNISYIRKAYIRKANIKSAYIRENNIRKNNIGKNYTGKAYTEKDYTGKAYLWEKNSRGIFHDTYNLLALLIAFNSIIYGLYYWEGFRDVVEGLIPPLKGWQFNRTVFFNPFLWYASFFLVLKRLYDSGRKWRKGAANLLALAAIGVIMLSDTRYNDLGHTCFRKALELTTGKVFDQLTYGEFYSAELFAAATEAIGYQEEWSAAYGFYPAILEYNGISTLDGYLGFYPQKYKEAFREVIAPELERVPESRIYYDEWGARVNLYSGNYPSVNSDVKNFPVTEDELYMNAAAFKALGGKYIFSRLVLLNPEEAGVELVLSLTGAEFDSPYNLYVYEVR